jgi:hydrogenase large subunit
VATRKRVKVRAKRRRVVVPKHHHHHPPKPVTPPAPPTPPTPPQPPVDTTFTASITIDPVTRIEGHLKVQVELDSAGVVTQARVAGQLFRDFENILVGRDAMDPVHLTQRVCGVCPVSHAIAATKTVEAAAGFTPSDQAVWLRALIQGGNFLQDHILHFYHLNLMDYVEGPAVAPLSGANTADLRITGADRDRLIADYIQALGVRRRAQEMVAILAGKVPHVATIVPGGVTQSPTAAQMTDFTSILSEVAAFVRDVYVPDAEFVASKYADHFQLGRGPASLMSLGGFDLPGGAKFFKPGRLSASGSPSAVDIAKIAEDVRFSYYTGADASSPSTGTTVPAFAKAGAYTWLKAPRYAGEVVEVGPLARMKVSGLYAGGVSVMDRVLARAHEALAIAEAMPGWAANVTPDAASFTRLGAVSGTSFGVTEAPRGSLGHWARFTTGTVAAYQIITPTCWNASPRDSRGVAGAMEQALAGVTVADRARPVELVRVVHSFDPCTGCAVHMLDFAGGVAERFVIGLAGGVSR